MFLKQTIRARSSFYGDDLFNVFILWGIDESTLYIKAQILLNILKFLRNPLNCNTESVNDRGKELYISIRLPIKLFTYSHSPLLLVLVINL